MTVIIAVLAVLVVVFAATWIAGALGDDEDVRSVGITLGDVASDPETYEGERVVVSGAVQRQLTDRLFVLGDEEILVYAEQGLDIQDPDSVVAQVEGTVAHGDAGATFDELAANSPGFQRPAEIEENDEVILIRSSSVVLNPFTAGGAGEGVTEGSDTAFGEGVTDREGVLPASSVVQNASVYLGEQVTVGGELRALPISNAAVFNAIVFDAENLLVLSAQPAAGTFPVSVTASATGTLVELDVREAEAALGIELDDDALEQYVGELTLLADSFHYFFTGDATGNTVLAVVGEEVTIVSSIQDVLSDQVFSLESGTLVVVPEGVEAEPLPKALARVDGTAAVLGEDARLVVVDDDGTATELEGLGPSASAALRALSEDDLQKFEGSPAVIANSVEITR